MTTERNDDDVLKLIAVTLHASANPFKRVGEITQREWDDRLRTAKRLLQHMRENERDNLPAAFHFRKPESKS
jgi:hypothetical protein